jgi:hypothetical protein
MWLACPSGRLKTKALTTFPMLIKTHCITFPCYIMVILKCAQGCVSGECLHVGISNYLFLVYFTTLSLSQIIERRTVG